MSANPQGNSRLDSKTLAPCQCWYDMDMLCSVARAPLEAGVFESLAKAKFHFRSQERWNGICLLRSIHFSRQYHPSRKQ